MGSSALTIDAWTHTMIHYFTHAEHSGLQNMESDNRLAEGQ